MVDWTGHAVLVHATEQVKRTRGRQTHKKRHDTPEFHSFFPSVALKEVKGPLKLNKKTIVRLPDHNKIGLGLGFQIRKPFLNTLSRLKRILKE